MARRILDTELQAIEEAVHRHQGGATAQQIIDSLQEPPPRRTLQYRLKYLVDHQRLVMEGEGRWARYRLPPAQAAAGTAAERAEAQAEAVLPLSESGAGIQAYVRRPPEARKPVGYNRAFLDSYRPNESFYLTATQRAHLREIGTPTIAEQPAGGQASRIRGMVGGMATVAFSRRPGTRSGCFR
ncbi:hypothetical protein [Mesorhizobium sp. J8]|uniref:hypothetical protein n=1 Tax=Mesorhizobium sp. J8 TaxID=2777475 RepID=UPI001915F463|nr:hypothetical protein [Mesorhizobium sp. J8]BCM17604.1 hypothetical protein MJ8_13700 [Mesorhizobium sp. J8]